ncbi:DNA polymerase III subunit epsilon [sulfur-oxidizing endosymbiont of Gigantopelta aegis]|uniref:DNA polymerase III subunit epsilon n=1 Tax=sulfur-oxidizing endosymbiont of Gigantopelta aegis TaxID=2794934 RepID=UPI0018DAFD70|nr:DNA polymerase III subunit epsilon [sulfur-oxidizing endosymbiont of Gigantopelta aegis]
MRQIVLDTETTGLEPAHGHRIIEIGCVEMVDRQLTGNTFHKYINPETKKVDQGALEVHGITDDFLSDKPYFADVYDEFLEFVKGCELIIHNAPFDVGFLNNEIKLLEKKLAQPLQMVDVSCQILDSLKLARENHPGQKNNLDALCRRYFIDNSNRQLHGALLDSEILADVYLAMTGGQTSLSLDDSADSGANSETIRRLSSTRAALKVQAPNNEELDAHTEYVAMLEKKSGQSGVWS